MTQDNNSRENVERMAGLNANSFNSESDSPDTKTPYEIELEKDIEEWEDSTGFEAVNLKHNLIGYRKGLIDGEKRANEKIEKLKNAINDKIKEISERRNFTSEEADINFASKNILEYFVLEEIAKMQEQGK